MDPSNHLVNQQQLLSFAMPFASLNIPWKNAEQNHFAELNRHVLTFLHPILICCAVHQ
jgi:hypothetical protein